MSCYDTNPPKEKQNAQFMDKKEKRARGEKVHNQLNW